MTLSDTQRVILAAAAQHPAGLARPPNTLPAAARNAVFRSLLKNNLLTVINAPREYVGLGWRQDEDGSWIVARITDGGLRAIGIDPNEGEAAAPDGDDNRPRHEQNGVDETLIYGPAEEWQQSERTPRGVRAAAQAVLAAWDASPAEDATDNPISQAIAQLRRALGSRLNQVHPSRMAAIATAEAKLVASLS